MKAANPNRILMVDFMAKGDDLDISGATNSIIGKIKYDKVSGNHLAQVEFHSKFYDEESGEKVYAMKGKLKDGLLLTTEFTFYCPVFEVWFINVWQVVGPGKFKTTDTDYDLTYRNWFPITMPNTGGKYEPAMILILLSPTAEYYSLDPVTNPPETTDNPIKILTEGGW
ncbi:MAG: hypothetical protein ACTSQU_13080, partial [Promethearchaeota archaeon]